MKKLTYADLEKRIRLLENELEQNHRNVSPEIQVNAATPESDEKYRIIFDNLTEAVALHKMITDNEGNIIDFTYEDLNPARERMINQTAPEIKKMTVRQANPDIDSNLFKLYGSTAITGVPLCFEYHSEVYSRDMKVKLFSHKHGYVGTIIEDVTDQKNSEKILRLNEKKLRELNLTKDKLFSIIAHDLRGPFNSIIGYSQFLKDNFRNYNAEETEKYLDIINSSAQNTFNLLVNLLSWAKNQTGQTIFKPESLELKKVAEEVAELLGSSAKTKNISISINLPSDLTIYADKNMLRTILQNLISNAIKFTNPAGRISINAAASTGNVEISVSDNGIGIRKKDIKNLFTLATANSTNGTSNETGSGLGLVLCREFVERHGGKIWVEGKPGKGTDFKFTMPLPDRY
jgi:signal transduction histidine kinase